MKKILSFLAACLCIFCFAQASKAAITDVPSNYWASKEINAILKDGVMQLDGSGKFNPTEQVTRAQFTSMLLRTLGHRETLATDVKFSDVDSSHGHYNDIMLSERIGLIYGYPDGTFKPEQMITKTETASVISHITRGSVSDIDVLNNFSDSANIPAWGRAQFAKTIEMNIYVNHPDAHELLPTKVLNRAEAAVLLYKLKLAFNLVKEEYKAPAEQSLGTEHLNVSNLAPVNDVNRTSFKTVVLAQNLLPAAFESKFNSKKYADGDGVVLVAPYNIVTQEGTLIIPEGTRFIGCVDDLIKQKIFNRNAKVMLRVTQLEFPNGTTVPCDMSVFDNKGVLTASKAKTFGKVMAYTVGGAALGSGIGVAAGAGSDEYGKGIAIGAPVGAGAGLLAGLITPGLAYKSDVDNTILFILNKDLVIPCK